MRTREERGVRTRRAGLINARCMRAARQGHVRTRDAGLIDEWNVERERVVARRRANRARDGRVQAQRLAHDRVEEGQAFERGLRRRVEQRFPGRAGGEQVRAAVGANSGLDVRLLGKRGESPP
jgi:hypothetical protein